MHSLLTVTTLGLQRSKKLDHLHDAEWPHPSSEPRDPSTRLWVIHALSHGHPSGSSSQDSTSSREKTCPRHQYRWQRLKWGSALEPWCLMESGQTLAARRLGAGLPSRSQSPECSGLLSAAGAQLPLPVPLCDPCLQHTRALCPPLPPRVCSNSHPPSQSCYRTISISVIPFFSCLQSFPESVSFPKSELFTLGSQGIRASASVLPMNSGLISFRID